MAVRKSKEETFSVKGNQEEWLKKAEQALLRGEFTNVKTNKIINQINIVASQKTRNPCIDRDS